MSSNRAGVLSGGIGFASRAIVQLLLFGVMLVATRLLSIEDFGAYSLASLFVILSRALFYVGPYEYLLKSQFDPKLYSSCFGANTVLAALSCIVLAGCCFAAPFIFGSSSVGDLIAWLTPSVLLVSTTAWYEAVLLRAVRVRRYYVTTLIGDTVGAAAAVWLLVAGYGVISLVIQTYVRLLVLLVLYAAMVRERPGFGAGIDRIREVLNWSRARYAAVMLNFTSAYGADLVLGATLSPAATGLYRASNRIVSTVTDLFAQPLQKIAQANLSAKYVRDGNVGTSWITMLAGVGAIAWAGLLTLAILAKDIVPFALGDKWTPAVPVVIAFCAIKAFALVDAVTTSFLVCHDRQRSMLRVQIGVAVAVLALAFATSPCGPVAVALAVGTATTAMSAIYTVMVVRLSHARFDALVNLMWTCAPPMLAVATGLGLFKLFAPPMAEPQAVAAGVAVAAVSFAAGAFAVRGRILSAIGSLGHSSERVAQAE